jgi:hypothetical protein
MDATFRVVVEDGDVLLRTRRTSVQRATLVADGRALRVREAAAGHIAFACVWAQFGLVGAYASATYALPPRVSWMSESAHVATCHAALWVLILLLYAAIRSSTSAAARISTSSGGGFFPVTLQLQEAVLACTTLTNALLLVVIGVEAWIRTELPEHTDLPMVQGLAVVEAVVALGCATWASVRHVQFVKVMSVEGGGGGGSLGRALLGGKGEGEEGGEEEGGSPAASGWEARASARPSTIPPIYLSGEAAAALQASAREMEAREAEAVAAYARAAALVSRSREGASGVASPGDAYSESDLSSLLKTTAEEYAELVAAHRLLQRSASSSSARLAAAEADLRRAAADVSKLRTTGRELKRAADKAATALVLEQEASAAAHAALGDMRLAAGRSGRQGSISPGRLSTSLGSPLGRTATGPGIMSPGGLAKQASYRASFAAAQAQPEPPVTPYPASRLGFEPGGGN